MSIKTLRYNNVVPNTISYGGASVKNVYYAGTRVYATDLLVGDLAVGNIITFDGLTWRVVHNEGNLWYLGHTTAVAYHPYFNTFDDLNNYLLTWMYNNLSQLAQQYLQDIGTSFKGKSDNYVSKVVLPLVITNSTAPTLFVQYQTTISGKIIYRNRNLDYYKAKSGNAGLGFDYWSGIMDRDSEAYAINANGVSYSYSRSWYDSNPSQNNRGIVPHICIVKP